MRERDNGTIKDLLFGVTADSQAMSTRSIRVRSCVTSVRLERLFWNILLEISSMKEVTLGQMISEIFYAVEDECTLKRINKASLLRLVCVQYLVFARNRAADLNGGSHVPLSKMDSFRPAEAAAKI